MAKKKTLFDTLYAGKASVMKAIKKPLAREALKRKLQGAHDSAENKIDVLKEEYQEELMTFMKADLQLCAKKKKEIRLLRDAQKDVREMWLELFSTEMEVTVAEEVDLEELEELDKK